MAFLLTDLSENGETAPVGGTMMQATCFANFFLIDR